MHVKHDMPNPWGIPLDPFEVPTARQVSQRCLRPRLDALFFDVHVNVKPPSIRLQAAYGVIPRVF